MANGNGTKRWLPWFTAGVMLLGNISTVVWGAATLRSEVKRNRETIAEVRQDVRGLIRERDIDMRQVIERLTAVETLLEAHMERE